MSNGKDYEIFVQTLQQAFLDSEQLTSQTTIEIERNKRITDTCGIKREFDLYWEYELAGITYKTVIECKDYAVPVSVEKIDALIGKIRDIPDLKPVFATKTGYQSGAEKKARNNKIDLLIVREQRDTDWKDKFRELGVQMHFDIPPRITGFHPVVDREWIRRNTNLNPTTPPTISGLNNEIFIEDLVKNETYSLFDLAHRLESIAGNNYGDLSHSESFENAYLIADGLRLKMNSYKVEYVRSETLESSINIDFSKELIGVIEYLSKGSSTAVFRDTIVKNWNQGNNPLN